MAKLSDMDPRPACPECQSALVLADTSDLNYHWRCPEPDCNGTLLVTRNQSLPREAIARDIADKRSRTGVLATSDERRKDQAAFRRAASALSQDHRLFRYLSSVEIEAMKTAAGALRRLARATETAKEIMARREVQEKRDRQRQYRIDNEQAFQKLIAQTFDRDTVVLRCEALANFFETMIGYGGYDVRAWVSAYRNNPDERRWSQLVQSTGERINEEMLSDRRKDDFESYWREWKAGRRYRAALNDAHTRGDPDV